VCLHAALAGDQRRQYFAIRLFVVLDAKYADRATGECFPWRQTIADYMGVSLSTVDAGIAELTRVGALVVSKKSNGAMRPVSNVYTIIRSRPKTDHDRKIGVGEESGAKSHHDRKITRGTTTENHAPPNVKNHGHQT
jgi:hypothetical protein